MGLFDAFKGKPHFRQAEPDVDWAAAYAQGDVDGRHYAGWFDTARQLKRDGRLAEAEQLLQKLCAAADREAEVADCPPTPWPYEQLAIVYRKRGDFTGEIATLEHYAERWRRVDRFGRPSQFAERLQKARALLSASHSKPQPFCPYCGVEIVPMPKGGRKCPACGETVVVKRVGEAVSLLTLEQAEENLRPAEARRAEKKTADRLHRLGFTQADLERTAAKLAKKWGTQPSEGDVFWSLSNQAVLLASKRADWAALAGAYRFQGDILEEEGRVTADADGRANDAMLRYYEGVCKSLGLPREVIASTRKACCPECSKRADEVVRIADARAVKALPNRACTNGRCRCTWRVDYSSLREP